MPSPSSSADQRSHWLHLFIGFPPGPSSCAVPLHASRCWSLQPQFSTSSSRQVPRQAGGQSNVLTVTSTLASKTESRQNDHTHKREVSAGCTISLVCFGVKGLQRHGLGESARTPSSLLPRIAIWAGVGLRSGQMHICAITARENLGRQARHGGPQLPLRFLLRLQAWS